jgi:uncharacterized delta-60 repeat protein
MRLPRTILVALVAALVAAPAATAAPRGVVSFGAGQRPVGTHLVQLRDGRLVVGGVVRQGRDEPAAVMRFSARGKPDRRFGRRGIGTRVLGNGFFNAPTNMLVEPGGAITLVADVSISENAGGVAAALFAANGSARGDVSWVKAEPDFAGEFERYDEATIVRQAAGPPLLLVNSWGGFLRQSPVGCAFALTPAFLRAGPDSCLPWDRARTEARFNDAVPDPRGGAIVAIGGSQARGPAAADTYGLFGIARVDAAGVLDPSFGTQSAEAALDFGVQASHLTLVEGARTIAPRPGGGWVVAGPVPGGWGFAGFTATGAVDPAFGNQGKVVVDPDPRPDPVQLYSLTPLRDGRLLAVGANAGDGGVPKGYAALLNGDGSLAKGFGRRGKVVITPRTLGTDEVYSLTGAAEQKGGRIVLVGTGWSNKKETTTLLLFRLKRSGALDRTFGR